uniref:Uncharacterized protein n=1 Tax=Moniliophthora roreri TaxID=221103 RepID=A0A0W0EXH8_MONRR
MAGANYMGGKRYVAMLLKGCNTGWNWFIVIRSAARARAKNTTGCVQKRFFGQQRLNLALRKLEAGLGVRTRIPKSTAISAISFAHAKNPDNLPGFIPEPIRVAPCTPTSRSRLSKLNEDEAVSSTRSSSILEALDTKEPVSLRAAMDKILTLPDLAGLSNQTVPRSRPCLRSKRQKPSPPSSPCGKRQKRQKFSSPLPPSSAPRTASSPISIDFLSEEGSGDWGKNWDGAFEQNMKNEGCEDGAPLLNSLTSCIIIISSNRLRPTFPLLTYRHESHHFLTATASFLSPQEQHVRSSHRNIRYPLIPSSGLSTASVVPGNIPRGQQQQDESQLRFSFSGNIFDYEDPWKAVGLILGIEEAPHTPLRTRNFHAMLAELPSDPAFGRDSGFDTGSGSSCDSLFSGDSLDSVVTSGSRTMLNSRSSGACDATPEFPYQSGQAVHSDVDLGNEEDTLDKEMDDHTAHDADDSYKFSPLSIHSAHSAITLLVQLRPVTPENQVIRQSFHLRSPLEPMPSSSYSIFDTQISKPSSPLKGVHCSFNHYPFSSQSNATMPFSTSFPVTNPTPTVFTEHPSRSYHQIPVRTFAARSSKRVTFRKTFGGSEEKPPELSFSSPPNSYIRGSRIGPTFGVSVSPAPATTARILGPSYVLNTQLNGVPVAEIDHSVMEGDGEDMIPAGPNSDKDLKTIQSSHFPRETLLSLTAHPEMDMGHDTDVRKIYEEKLSGSQFSTQETASNSIREKSGDHTFSTRETTLTPTPGAVHNVDVQCVNEGEVVVGAICRGPDLFADDELDSD